MNGIMNPAQRKTAYVIYGILGVIVGATQIVLTTYDMSDVRWFAAVLGVYGVLGTAFGFVAANNPGDPIGAPIAPDQASETDVPEDEAVPVEWDEPADEVLTDEDYAAVDDAPTDESVEVDETPPGEDYEPRH